MPTLGYIKQAVANQLGKSDYGLVVERRDIAINNAREEYYKAADWHWAHKKTTLTFSGGVAPMPSDFQEGISTPQLYSYDGTEKTEYTYVSLGDVGSYGEDQYVWAIDGDANAFVSNQPTATVNLEYKACPTPAPLDTSQDGTNELAPNVSAIIYSSIAKYWLNSERDDDMLSFWENKYQEQLRIDRLMNRRSAPPQPYTTNNWPKIRASQAVRNDQSFFNS